MRALVVAVALAACSHPPKHSNPPPAAAEDAATPIDAAVAEATPDAQAQPVEKPALFDWVEQRKRQDDARAARLKLVRPHHCEPDPNDPNKGPCATHQGPLAANGKVVGTRDADSTIVMLQLDIGSDDGVTGSHWGAVIDDEGHRLTKFHRIVDVVHKESAIRVEPGNYPMRVRVALVPMPPIDERGSP